MKLVTVEQMRGIEAVAEASGVSLADLMQTAGAAVAEVVQTQWGPAPGVVLVLVGPGKNGGDGLVAAQRLHEADTTTRAYVVKHAADDPVYQAAQAAGVPITRFEEDPTGETLAAWLQESDILVDALLGIGVSRLIEGDLAALLTRVREGKREDTLVVAVDLPSGVNADTGAADPLTLPADVTVTFGYAKLGLFQPPAAHLVGDLVVADIGLDPRLGEEVRVEFMTAEWARDHLPARPEDGHKGTFGKAMIVAGSVNYTGAAYLAGAAAARVGAGLVTLAVAQMLYPILAARLVETTWLLLPHEMGAVREEAAKVLLEKIEGYTALLVGPGLGSEETTQSFVRTLLSGKAAPVKKGRRVGFSLVPEPEAAAEEGRPLPPTVIDADGLNALAGADEWWTSFKPTAAVLTPHPGEMGRLLGSTADEVNADRVATARRAAEKFGQVIVLKGAHTVIAAPDGQVAVSPFANPALATAGTGDVLAGTITGLLAQGLTPFDAAAVGVYLHGLAGERVREELGDAGAVASDLLPYLPLSIQSLKLEE
ncbi:MAG: NAD(P)H-hydrate dehydratase [Anaerolineae bacterium]|nr:NAD(P)H-hydrate dehydratase [Anaerolineae bacterium]